MSLASFLLGTKSFNKKKAIDTELDAVFHSQLALNRPETIPKDQPIPVKKKKKRTSNSHDDEPGTKRHKSWPAVGASTSISPSEKPTRVSEPVLMDTVETHESHSGIPDKDGDERSNFAHESLQNANSGRRAKYTPSDETEERRDARTIFIGNLPPDVATKRPLQKQLRRHILALLPTAKIESTRFRSVAFQTPTSKLPEASDDVKKDKQPRQHVRDRASSWRDAHIANESKTDEKKFLTPSQKKKIAFINKEIHSDADSVHAYVVFAYPPQPHARPTNLPPLPLVMDPFEAAQTAIEKCNGTIFLDHMLRVDTAIKRSMAESSSDDTLSSLAIGDPRLTVFVGNLDFTSKEEDLRVFFEGVVSAERGPPDTEGSQDEDKPRCWVTRVRVIRDKDTQLGKGFAYVQFSDRTCVDEILALESGKLKFSRRKLRVQRCKSIPSTSSVNNAPSKPAQTSNHIPVPPVPKGDPSLGEKLARLTKEERKRVKATDVDRVARRIAKKKARMALAKQRVSLPSKQRERLRKTGPAKKTGGAPPKKGRARSERSIAKMNTKK